MNNFEDPIDFSLEKKFHDIEIEYSEVMEISQGGPVVGNLSVNGKRVKGRYGGPMICTSEYLYAPILVSKFLGSGFKLAKINVGTLEVSQLGKTKDLIYLDKLGENRIFYFEDLDRAVHRYMDL